MSSKFRILFLGTPEFAVESLQRLIDDKRFEVAAVISQPDRPAGRKMQLKASPVKELALKHGLQVFTPETVNTEEFRTTVKSLGCESAVVVAFGQILGQKFLDLFPRGAVNIHGSVLPRWRGAAPIQRAVMAGDSESGVALQVIVKKLDAGALIGIRRLAIPDEMTALELHDQLKVLGADLLQREYVDYLHGSLAPVPQDESQVTYASKIEKSEGSIDWTLSAREIHNRVRGLTMGPGAFTILPDGKVLKVHRTRMASTFGESAALGETGDQSRVDAFADNGSNGKPGSVLSVGASSLMISCGEGALELLEVQPESRSRMGVVDFLRGYSLKPGDQFTTRVATQVTTPEGAKE